MRRVSFVIVFGVLTSGAAVSARAAPVAPVSLAATVRQELLEGPAPDWQIDVIEVATGKLDRKLIYAGTDLPQRVQAGFYVSLVSSGDRRVLVDTGFVEPKLVREWGLAGFRDASAGLQALGITPEQVTDVVITHEHWDHVGGLGLFPRATLWVTRDTYQGLTKASDSTAARALDNAAQAHRLRLADPIQRLAPGIVLLTVGLHTLGSQVVFVRTGDDLWALSADEGPLERNFTKLVPSGQTTDANASRLYLETILGVVGGRVDRVLPGHDPGVMLRCAKQGARVVRCTGGSSVSRGGAAQ